MSEEKFLINKQYKLVIKSGFMDNYYLNPEVYDLIKTKPFKVLDINNLGSVVAISIGGKKYYPSEISNKLQVFMSSDERIYFEEDEEIQSHKDQVDNKELIAVFINGTEQFVIGPLAKKELDSRIKDFLIEDGRIVKIFEHTANASINVYYEDVK